MGLKPQTGLTNLIFGHSEKETHIVIDSS